nr:hypothetical protein [Candidatus Bathyarchaeota archaeon]
PALAAGEGGDAGSGIAPPLAAGGYADPDYPQGAPPEHVGKAAPPLSSVITPGALRQLSRHELLALLGIARHFRHSTEPHATTGEAELAYQVACEEAGEQPRGHTQYWKYLNRLSALDAVSTKLDTSERGRTQLISLMKIPAESLEQEVTRVLEEG